MATMINFGGGKSKMPEIRRVWTRTVGSMDASIFISTLVDNGPNFTYDELIRAYGSLTGAGYNDGVIRVYYDNQYYNLYAVKKVMINNGDIKLPGDLILRWHYSNLVSAHIFTVL